MSEPPWDAIVIGAGPAGSVAARELARRGAKVLLLDKATFPRPKVCGCCLNGAALAALESIGLGHIPSACGGVPLRSTMLAAGRRTAELRLTGVALSREAFDRALIREAEASGVVFQPDTLAKVDEQSTGETRTVMIVGGQTKPISGDILAVSAAGRPLRARIVIRATGLAGSGAAPTASSRLGAGTIIPRAHVPKFFSPGTVYMAAGRGGYVGLVRVEDGRLDIGAALDAGFVRSSGSPGSAAAAILADTDWPAIPDLDEAVWKGTPALTRRPATLAEPRLFRVGDAAGYVEPFTGEGMAWAIGSAAALAPLAHRAALHWDDRFIRDWRIEHSRIVGRQGICRIASRVLRSPRLTGAAVRALAAWPALARPVVALLNRPALRAELPS